MKTGIDVGQRVQYLGGGSWKPTGKITETRNGISMNGALLISPKVRVEWDNGDTSGWLSVSDFTFQDSDELEK
jgi:hypothetical protein